MFAHRLSIFLSRLALVAVALAFCITYYEYPPIGYAGIVFVSSVAVVLAIGAGLLAIALAVLILLRRLPAKPWNPIAFASLAIALALAYVWLL